MAILTLAGAIFAVGVSVIARSIGCTQAFQGDCDGGLPVLLIAVAGLVPAAGMVYSSGWRHGHPWRWFLATAIVYTVWGITFSQEVT